MPVIKLQIPSNGSSISAVVHSCTNSSKLAILCPGFLDSKDYPHLVQLAKMLNHYGYTVVRFDPTGTWESEGNIENYTVTQYLDDIKNIIEYMLKKNTYEEILLAGHSRGGQVSVLYSARDPRITKVLVIMSTYGSLDDEEWMKSGSKISERDLPYNPSQTRLFGVPYTHLLDWEKYDALEAITKIKVPIILIAGEKDVLIPPEDVKEFYESANEPKKYTVIKNIGHNYRFSDDEISKVNQEIKELLELGK